MYVLSFHYFPLPIERKVKSDWEEEKRFFEDRGLKLDEMDRRKKEREREEWCNELVREERETDRRER